jgi:hypothetical protein
MTTAKLTPLPFWLPLCTEELTCAGIGVGREVRGGAREWACGGSAILNECNRLVTTVSAAQQETRKNFLRLLQLGVFGFDLLHRGEVGVGVFPEGENVLIR